MRAGMCECARAWMHRRKWSNPSQKCLMREKKKLRHKGFSKVSSCSAYQLMKKLHMIFMKDEI